MAASITISSSRRRRCALGKYSYTPAHGDVALRLILYGKGVGVAGDAVHVTAIRM